MFGVEEEGELQESEEQKQKTMSELVEYLKKEKFCELESIGFHFDLSIEVRGDECRKLWSESGVWKNKKRSKECWMSEGSTSILRRKNWR